MARTALLLAAVSATLASPALSPRPGDTWLFKASRRMALERVLGAVRSVAAGPREGAERLAAREAPPA